ncbi:MAG: hypothetical protein ABII90_07810 [Bacteroidota bacterium]
MFQKKYNNLNLQYFNYDSYPLNLTCIQTTSDGGYIITGGLDVGAGYVHAFLLRLDSQGDVMWAKSYASSSTDWGNFVEQTADGGFVVVGITHGFLTQPNDMRNILIFKTDDNGTLQWTRTYSENISDYGTSIKQTPDGGYIVLGTTGDDNSTIFGFGDIILIKLNETGQPTNYKIYGDYGYDVSSTSVLVTADGGYIVTGWEYSSNYIDDQMFLIKTDPQLNVEWSKQYGSTIGGQCEWALNVQQTDDDNDGIKDDGYILVGSSTFSGYLNSKLAIVKTDINGTQLWAKIYSGPNNNDRDKGFFIQQTSDNGFIISATIYRNSLSQQAEDACLIKTDIQGNMEWAKGYGNLTNQLALTVLQNNDGGYIFSGYTEDYPPQLYIVKTNPLGQVTANPTEDCFEYTPDFNVFDVTDDYYLYFDEFYINTTSPFTIYADYTDLSVTTLNVTPDDICSTPCTSITPTITTACTTFCHWETVTLDAGVYDSYLWSTLETTQTITAGMGEYTVTVFDADGCWGTDNITISPNPPVTETSYIVTTTTPETWEPGAGSNPFGSVTGEVLIEDQLIFNPGVNITIKNMTFRFGPGAVVILEKGTSSFSGSKLTLDNTIFTTFNCCEDVYMWNGIQVWGYDYQSQLGANTKQGCLIVQNNSLIENARIAAQAKRPGYNYGYNGGIIKATNSTFRNNGNAVLLWDYDNTLPVPPFVLINNISFFRNCTFITTGQLNDPNEQGYYNMRSFVVLNSVDGINFHGNTFKNAAYNIFPVEARGNGIYGLNSSFRVLPLCTDPPPIIYPCHELQPNTFTGLLRGIRSITSSAFDAVIIDGNEFSNNMYGAFLSGHEFSVVTSNQFDVGTSYNNTIVNSTGLYLQGCSGYKVQDNNFFASYQHPNIGAIIRESGTDDNVIYNNTFSNLAVGCEALELNDDVSVQFKGLQIRCNELNNNQYHIYVIDGEISREQGFCDGSNSQSPAGNTFTHTCPFPPSDYYLNKGEPTWSNQGILYDHHSDYITTPVCFTNNTTAPNVFGTQVMPSDCSVFFIPGDCETCSCPHEFIGFKGGGKRSVVKQNISNYDNEIAGLKQLIDGGDKKALLDMIFQDMPPGQVKNAFLAASPYLSDEVLIGAIDKKATPLPPGILKDILIPNSPLTPSVMKAVDKRKPGLPNGVMNQVNAAQTGVSARDELMLDIAYLESMKSFATDELIRLYLYDTTLTITASYDSVIAILKGEETYEAEEKAVAGYIKQKEYDKAQQLIDTLHPDGVLDNYCKLMSLIIEMEQTQEKVYIMQTDPVKEMLVRAIADDTTHKTHFNARALLTMVFGDSYHVRIEFPVQQQNKMEYSFEDIEQEQVFSWLDENHKLRCFPNPFINYTSIEAYVPEDAKDAGIIIYNLLGIEIKKYPLAQHYNIVTVLNKDLPGDGIYFFALKYNDRLVEKRKLVIIN